MTGPTVGALCVGVWDLWTSDLAYERHQAVEICVGCPVIAACHKAADENNATFGVWASYDREMKQPGRIPGHRLRCGTPAAFIEHLRQGHNPCQPCRDARLKQHHRQTAPPPPRRKTAKPPKTVQPCGTYAAAQRHRYRREPLCEPCKHALNDYRRQHRKGTTP